MMHRELNMADIQLITINKQSVNSVSINYTNYYLKPFDSSRGLAWLLLMD